MLLLLLLVVMMMMVIIIIIIWECYDFCFQNSIDGRHRGSFVTGTVEVSGFKSIREFEMMTAVCLCLSVCSAVYLLGAVHEVCVESPATKHASVCMSLQQRMSTTYSAQQVLRLPVSVSLAVQTVCQQWSDTSYCILTIFRYKPHHS